MFLPWIGSNIDYCILYFDCWCMVYKHTFCVYRRNSNEPTSKFRCCLLFVRIYLLYVRIDFDKETKQNCHEHFLVCCAFIGNLWFKRSQHLHKSIYKFTENAKHIAELMSSQYSLYNRWQYFLAGLKYKCPTNSRNKKNIQENCTQISAQRNQCPESNKNKSETRKTSRGYSYVLSSRL